MPLTDQARIEAEKNTPHIVKLWRALVPLQTIVSFMNTGAHPDDEMSEMLAAMSLRDGIDISYACSTRGEGGQNDIGTESGKALGVLRTAEMERACDVLNLRMYWHSQTPDDTIFDFGFSKSGNETIAKWGRKRTLKRFVDIIRTERPDIICPTFLDVPGQHGHHRAMTEAAHQVMSLAADPDFEDCDLPPWQIRKMYLPAWSGAGQAYDDDLPPPPATLTINASGIEPVTGWSYARIGQQSRAFHKTQAMGRWIPAGGERDFPLHLAESRVDGPDNNLSSGLAATLAELDAPDISVSLTNAQKHIEFALKSFPDNTTIIECGCASLGFVRDAISRCPPDHHDEIMHKLLRKEEQLSHLLVIAARAEITGRAGKDKLHCGDATELTIEQRKGLADSLKIEPKLPASWDYSEGQISIGNQVTISDPYPAVYLPHIPAAPCLSVSMGINGTTVNSVAALEIPPIIVPEKSAKIGPTAIVLNLKSNRRNFQIKVEDIAQADAILNLDLPSGWTSKPSDYGFDITAPNDVAVGQYDVPLTVDGAPAQSVTNINYSHISPRALANPATVKVQVIDVNLPDVRVGYIGAGNDRVDHWMAEMGLDVTNLTDSDLQSDQTLSNFDTIVIGIFAIKFRKKLLEQMPRLHKWCEDGGNLISLYHRPWDNWDPLIAPPKYLKIGQPSLRWRVTNENSDVLVIEPDHPIFNRPNVITNADWEGWHKERGLYFAMDWDTSYTPLLSMSDEGEDPLLGSMLTAKIGDGCHTHTSLILHHQMENLTPGAFRIMANLVQKYA